MDLQEPDRSGFVELNRTRLRLWEWGDPAGPPVLCVHGGFDHGRMWDGFAPLLAAEGFRVVAIDVRGHGDSGRLSSGHAWGAVALDLACLARHLGAPIGVIGHSFGGGQSLGLAAVWPELVRWVVNLDGLGPPPAAFAPYDIADAARDGLRSYEKVLGPPRVYPTLADMAARRGQINIRLPQPWLDHLVTHASAPVEGGFVWKVDPLFRVGLPNAFSLDTLLTEYALVQCPVLALTGSEHDTWSELSPDELASRLSRFRDARHQVIAGAGHYVHIEQPDQVLDAVRKFVAEVDGLGTRSASDADVPA